MKSFLKITGIIVLIAFFVSCQSNSDVKQILSKPDTRKEIIDTIANDSSMAKEMMDAMMASSTGMTMMQDHQKMMMQDNESMMKMMKDNPAMMQGMMSNMMETAKSDTSMMSGMCKMMMGNQQMMDMMQKMKVKNMGMKMGGRDKK